MHDHTPATEHTRPAPDPGGRGSPFSRAAASPGLPILERREEIEAALRAHQVIVLCGETGSGKTTQLPQICLDMGLAAGGMIGHTQPRRLAARAVAGRIAHERGEPLGGTVGVKVRFHEQTSRRTRIKVLTDGMLLAELGGDPDLRAYSTLIIDEAHERSLNIDFLLGYLRTLLSRRPELKLIITSATIDPHRFSVYFNNAPVIEVSGRMFPVEIRYRATRGEDDPDRIDFEALADAASDLCIKPGAGDVLVFLPGEREIRLAGDALARAGVDAAVLPLYSRLSDQQQDEIFTPHAGGRRRIILATNVAETSLTVPGIRFVIDSGVARLSRYDPARKVQRLPVEPISQASANQRSGRCGRVAAGVCIRLFSESSFDARPRFTDPEIRRTSLANVILQMKSLGFGAVEEFPFLDPPDPAAIKDGYETLFELGAITSPDRDGRLTPIGGHMSRLPLDARIARVLIGAAAEDVVPQATVLAGALSIQDPRERPMGKQEQADRAQSIFRDETSDFLTLLKLWDQYQHAADTLTAGPLASWCRDHFLAPARMREWGELNQQLERVLKDVTADVPLTFLKVSAVTPNAPAMPPLPLTDRIHRALLTGLISNVACREGDGSFDYRGVRGNVVQIFPGSTLFKKGPKWIMAGEVVHTTRLYARTIARIDPAWIEELAGHMFRHQVSDPHLNTATGEPMAWERVTMSGIVVVPRREASLEPLDAGAARRVFVREALAGAAWESDLPFMQHNRAMLAHAEQAEARLRRRDVRLTTDQLAEWFEARLPRGLSGPETLVAWMQAHGDVAAGAISLSPSDVLQRSARDALSAGAFPDAIALGQGGEQLATLSYALAPGKAEDGVTATVELSQLPQVVEDRAEWLVLGMLPAVILGLLKLLPKPVRQTLEAKARLEDIAADAAGLMTFGQGSLAVALAEAVGVLHSVTIDAAMFKIEALPPHLRLRIGVVDHHGKEIAEGRDLSELRQRLDGRIKKALAAQQRTTTDRRGITAWDFGPLPDSPQTAAPEGQTHLALIDHTDSVTLTHLASARVAAAHTALAVRRLFALATREEAVYYVEALPAWPEMVRQYAQLGSPDELRAHIINITAGRLFLEGQPPVRTAEAFDERLLSNSGRLATTTREVGETIGRVLEPRFLVAKRLAGGTPRIWAESIADIREHAAYLLPRDFLRLLTWERLRHYPRYVGTLWERLLAMREDGSKANLEPLKVLLPHWKRLTGVIATAMNEERRGAAEAGVEAPTAPGTSKPKAALPQARRAAPTVNADAGAWAMQPGCLDPGVEQYRWAVEELRVTLFAPQLSNGTSPADLDRLWPANSKGQT